MKKACSIIVCVLSNAAVFFTAEWLIDLIRNSNQPKVSGVLYIEPLVTIADLLLAIGLIGLGLSILAIIITVEICYFRKGGAAHDAARNRRKPKELSHAGRSIRSVGLQALFYKLSSKGRPFQTWIRSMPYGIKRENPEAGFPALAQVWERGRAH